MGPRDARDLALATRLMPVATDDDGYDGWDAYDDEDDVWSVEAADGPLPADLSPPLGSPPSPPPPSSAHMPPPGETDAVVEPVEPEPELGPAPSGPHPGQLLYDLLAEGRAATALTGAEVDAGVACLTAIAAEAAGSTVERHAEIDEWITGLLARTTARSNPLIGPAGRLFGWEARTSEFHLPPALDHLVAPQRGMNFVEGVGELRHSLNSASVELTTPATDASRRGWFVKRGNVARLLTTTRRDVPHVEDEYLDTHRLSLWENAGAGTGRGGGSPGSRSCFGS